MSPVVDTTPSGTQAAMIESVLSHQHQRLALPTVAANFKVTLADLQAILKKHGYPDADVMRRAVQTLRANPGGATPDQQPRSASSPAPDRPAASAAPSSAPQPDQLRALLDTARSHESKRIQNAANKVAEDLHRLQTLIREDREKHAARRRAEKAKADARAEVERLEAQLAEARAKLRPAKTTKTASASTTDGPSAATVRAWAAEHDVECPAVGRVPNTVRQAYDAAHSEASA